MADSNHLSHSANRRAQIIAAQAGREAAAAPTNWRAKRKRRSYTSWNTPAPAAPQPEAQPTAPAADPSDGPDAKE
jgi:hypothetical protein